MVDESDKKFFYFFFDYGWLVYFLLIANEKWGLPILTNLLMSDNQFSFYIASVVITILAVGIPGALMGAVSKTGPAALWAIVIGYLSLAML